MKLYNTLTREKQEFVPLKEKEVKMYACGPTVYNYFHIGNARVFVLFDMLRRYFEYRGYKVTFAQNFTDIDDKMIKRAAEENTTVAAIAERYIAEYKTDAEGLGVRPATYHPRATENMDEIIDIIKTLVDKGYAYEAGGDVYFRTTRFEGYGKLAHMPIDDLESGARVAEGEIKDDPLDFALWKGYKEGEPYWESPWGKGRPGWHIECSAMVRAFLGETIDIHCGGMDLTFPHHENEIAQSEAANGKPFVNYWLHNGYINIDNKKMSKSLGNFFTVRDAAKEYGYDTLRFFLLSAHYRSPINYSKEILEGSKSALERIYNCADSLDFYIEHAPEEAVLEEDKILLALSARRGQFIAAMDDDFNTADAIAAIFELVKDINQLISDGKASVSLAKGAREIFSELTSLMGFVKAVEDGGDSAKIEEMISARAAAKKEKNYRRADEIRAELLEMGIVLEDTAQGTKWKRIQNN